MAKVADRYFEINPWSIVEEGFAPEYGMVAESVFSLGNEYMGVRGYFEEEYEGDSLLGSYFNGVYERRKAPGQGYKGIVQETEFMVNSLDWLYVRLDADGERLDLHKADFEKFQRRLDLKTGLLTRSFVWNTAKGKIQITFERLISMVANEEAAQRMTVVSEDYSGKLEVSAGLDFDTVHGGEKMKLWDFTEQSAGSNLCHIKGRTKCTGMEVSSYCALSGTLVDKAEYAERTAGNAASHGAVPVVEEKKVYMTYTVAIQPGETLGLEKTVVNVTAMSKYGEAKGECYAAENCEAGKNGGALENPQHRVRSMRFEELYRKNADWWEEVWKKSDIEIFGDEENQQGIRFCIFQMFQTYHGAVEGTNIGAKGLTGEAYNGNAFWDTETYCLPFFLFHDRQAAKNLLYFRYATLDEARKRARELDCRGAFYPIATISGRECCNLWQHASLQLQASTAVAYGIWMYEKVTGDTSFTKQYGLEILIEICRMLATRGDYNSDHTYYGYYGVMGPDEFQMMVNNNCYTNYMARFTFRYTLEVLERMQAQEEADYNRVTKALGFCPDEAEDWRAKADSMYILYDEEKKLFEQHQGFFGLPHIDVDAIPIEEFPLYHHWTYDRIYRNDMIKQPDVLMFMLMFNSAFSLEQLRKNYEYYEPRCIHESSLSPSVHSILAAQLGKSGEAFDFFGFATRMDLDNYNRNSGEGLHTTSIAAAWMNIVYGFGGLRSDDKVLKLSPTIPEKWERYGFRIVYNEDVICVEVNKENVLLKTLHGSNVKICIYDKEAVISGTEQAFAVANPELAMVNPA